MKRIVVYISLFLITTSSYSQSNFSISANSLGYCFANSNTHLYKNSLNDNLPLDLGLILSYDTYIINDVLSAKLQQALIVDRGNKMLGFSAFSLNQRFLKSYKHSINIYIGLSILYRQTWSDNSTYVDDENFILTKETEYKPFQVTGGIEYGYELSRKLDFITSVIYYHSNTLNLNFGVKYWFRKSVKKKRKCISCPNMH